MSAKYWIAQHVEDLFRKEPRNVGVIIFYEGQTEAKFLGELENREMDGRKLKSFKNPEIYKQWVRYWRDTAKKGDLDELSRFSGKHYRIFEAGEITQVEGDSPGEIINFLYSTLVSEGGYAEAISGSDTGITSLSLENELITAFQELELLNNHVKHPIERGSRVQGRTVVHKPSFIQQNGRLYVMETVDFTLSQKTRSRDHAGYAAYMYNDIRQEGKNIEPISIIRLAEEDQENEEVAVGLQILQKDSQVVNWLIDDQRQSFLKDCQRIASV